MPFTAIADTAKVEIIAHHTSTMIPIVNVLHVSCGPTPTNSHINDIANAIETNVLAFLNVWSPEWEGDSIQVTDLNVAGGFQTVNTGISGMLGTNAAGASPNNCGLVKLTTPLRSRSGRGRIYLSPISHAFIDVNGAIDSTWRTLASSFMDGFQTGLAAITPAEGLVVASRVLGGSDSVTGILIEALVASQRRRIAR